MLYFRPRSPQHQTMFHSAVPGMSLQRIPASITKVQPPVASTGSRTPTGSHAPTGSYSQTGSHAPAGSHAGQTGSQNKFEIKAFECVTCRMEFAYVKDLVAHIRKEQHTVPKIGCNFCKFKAEMAPDDVNKFMMLHTFDKVHLYNRSLVLEKQLGTKERRKLQPTFNQIRCDLCGQNVEDLYEHSNGKKHRSKGMYIFGTYSRPNLQLDDYETAPSFIQLTQNLTLDCLLI